MGDDRSRAAPPPGLAEAVLRATSGRACPGAEERLCAFVDGDLGGEDAELVGLHLATCPPCSALAAALRLMRSDLPALAEMDPGPGFAERVLARTASLTPGREPLLERMARYADDLLQRPRIAFESAYVGAFALMLVFGTPSSPLAEVPRLALDAASRNHVAGVMEPISRLEDQISGELHRAWSTTREGVETTSAGVAVKLTGKPGSILRKWSERIAGFLDRDGDERPPRGGTEPAEETSRHEEAKDDETDDRPPETGGRLEGDHR